MRLRKLVTFFIPLAAMLVGLPLAGAALSGRPLSPYLAFPPQTDFVAHAPFSPGVFVALTVVVLACLAPFLYCLFKSRPAPRKPAAGPGSFPGYAWLGLSITGVAWWLAWNRFDWFETFQGYTFTPLWLGYVLIVNGITRKRTGHCLLENRPRYLLALFLLSAAFWWFFEFLNRFVQNWHYTGIAHLGPWEYFWQATLPFSTVLPAVLSTRECLESFPRLSAGLGNASRIPVRAPAKLSTAALIVTGLGLAGLGVWPEQLFSLLWLAPLLVITSLQALHGERTIFHQPARGDWRGIWLAALAALVCGFFWELWNYNSLAHWEYSIPYVDRFEIFHMPVLGYSGYLPFGLECAAVASLLRNGDRQTQAADGR